MVNAKEVTFSFFFLLLGPLMKPIVRLLPSPASHMGYGSKFDQMTKGACGCSIKDLPRSLLLPTSLEVSFSMRMCSDSMRKRR